MTLDPYGPAALVRLTLTNLRIRLLKAQTCPAPLNPSKEATSITVSPLTSTSTTEDSASAPYAIYTLLARGTCLCHGHAEYCVQHNSSQDTRQDSNMVSVCSCECQSKRTGSNKNKDTVRESASVSFCIGLCSITVLYNTCVRMLGPDVKCSHRWKNRWLKGFKYLDLLFTPPAWIYFIAVSRQQLSVMSASVGEVTEQHQMCLPGVW